MHNKQLSVQTLIDFGLSEKEAIVYLSLLESELAGVNDISKKAGINRSSTYVVIESLKKKGLVVMSPDKKVQEYMAASPDTLLRIAQEKNERTARVKEKIEKILPELRALHKETTFRPKVVVYEGDEANKISHHETFDSSEFRIFKDLDDIPNTVANDYFEQDAKKRRASGVKMYLIAPNTDGNRTVVEEYKRHSAPDQFTLIPKNKFSRSASGKNIGIGIFKDRIKFSSAREKFAIFIINQAITDTLRDLFDLAWSESQRLSTEKTAASIPTKTKRAKR